MSECEHCFDENAICMTCHEPHVCSSTTCKFLFLNPDRTYVCHLTGKCYSQLLCHANDPHDEPAIFTNKINKKTQQSKNSTLVVDDVRRMLEKLSAHIDISEFHVIHLANQIVDLWNEIITRKLVNYIRRNDKFSVVVGAAFSLKRGLCNSNGIYIIKPCDLNFSSFVLNKKRKIDNGIQIKMIRSGQRFLRKAFENSEIIYNAIEIKQADPKTQRDR